jgi:hypothetical protein
LLFVYHLALHAAQGVWLIAVVSLQITALMTWHLAELISLFFDILQLA